MKFKKTAIRENLDPRNVSAIRYVLIINRHGELNVVDVTEAHFAHNNNPCVFYAYIINIFAIHTIMYNNNRHNIHM